MGTKKTSETAEVDELQAQLKHIRTVVTEALRLSQMAAIAMKQLDFELNGAKQLAARAGAHFETAWRQRYGADYAWVKRQDVDQLKKIILRYGIEEVENRMSRYLACGEKFYVNARHTFPVFLRSINTWVEAPHPTSSRPVSCPHNPPCASDAACTRRSLNDAWTMQ